MAIAHLTGSTPVTPPVAAAIASCAFVVPLALSLSSTPSPNHLRTMLWYLLLRKPGFKPPDWLIPATWTGIEAGWRPLRIDYYGRRRALLDQKR